MAANLHARVARTFVGLEKYNTIVFGETIWLGFQPMFFSRFSEGALLKVESSDGRVRDTEFGRAVDRGDGLMHIPVPDVRKGFKYSAWIQHSSEEDIFPLFEVCDLYALVSGDGNIDDLGKIMSAFDVSLWIDEEDEEEDATDVTQPIEQDLPLVKKNIRTNV